jgi:hypothetical protein
MAADYARSWGIKADDGRFCPMALYAPGGLIALATPEWIDLAVAAGTALLALATWRMAAATRSMARSSEDQLAELRRHADAAEATVDQAERTLGATTSPMLRVLRYSGEQAVVNAGDGGFSVMVENTGPVRATILEATLALAPQAITLEAAPGGAVAPGGQCLLRGDVPPPVLAGMLDGSVAVPLSLRYEGPGGVPVFTKATLKAKGGGDRWLVIEREQDKPHGGGRASW